MGPLAPLGGPLLGTPGLIAIWAALVVGFGVLAVLGSTRARVAGGTRARAAHSTGATPPRPHAGARRW